MTNPLGEFFSAAKDCKNGPSACPKPALGKTENVVDLLTTTTCSAKGVLKDSFDDMIIAAHEATGYEDTNNSYVTSVIEQKTDGESESYIEKAQDGKLVRDMDDDILPLNNCLKLSGDDNLANGVYAAIKAGKLQTQGPVASVEQVKNEMMSTCIIKAVANSFCSMGLARDVEAHDKIPDSTISPTSPTPHNSDGFRTPAPTKTVTPSSSKYSCYKNTKNCEPNPKGQYATKNACVKATSCTN